MMKQFRNLLLLVLLTLTACARTNGSAPLPAAAGNAGEAPSPTETPFPSLTLTASAAETEDLWLRFDWPPNEDVTVSTAQVTLQGSAPPETVLSINDEILLVAADGHFSLPLTLSPGINLVEVIASSPNGDEINLYLTITYESEQE